MKRRGMVAGLVLVLAVLGLFGWWSHRGPKVDGHSLNHWLREILYLNTERNLRAEAAFRAAGPRSFPLLRSALRQWDSGPRQFLMALDDRMDAFDFGIMRDDDKRRAALEAVHALGHRAAPLIPDVLASLSDVRVGVPASAFEPALVAMGPAALPDLIAFLAGDRGDPVQQAVVVAAITRLVRDHGTGEDSIPTLVRYAGQHLVPGHGASSIRDLSSRCAVLLGTLGRHAAPAVGQLVAFSTSTVAEHRSQAVAALADIGEPLTEILPALIARLADEERRVRIDTARALAQLGPDAAPAVPALAAALRDDSESFVLSALNALLRVGAAASNAAPALVQAATRPDLALRSRTAFVLGRIQADPRVAVPALIGLLADDNPNVKTAAASSLGRFGPNAAPAVPVLTAQLENGAESVQVTIVQALGRIGPGAAPAIPAMRLAWHSNQSALGPHVQAAIALITGQPVPPSPSP